MLIVIVLLAGILIGFVMGYKYGMTKSRTDVIEKEIVRDFIKQRNPTDTFEKQTEWEKGCTYICHEVYKLLR